MNAAATEEEIAAVDGLLGRPEPTDDHVALGGYHAAESQRNQLLPALHAVQSAVGWISEGALNYVCERLVVPPAEAYGVASFYALLATDERPRRVAHVCDDIACKLAGADGLMDELGARADVYPSPCLGQCERGPVALLQLAGESDITITSATADKIVDGLLGSSVPEAEGPGAAPQTDEERSGLWVLAGVGRVDPTSLDDYRRLGGYTGLEAAIAMGPAAVIDEIKTSNLRGRGGAAFPTGIKWESAAAEDEPVRYVVCNADESEPGTFKDRILIEGDPFAIVESTTIAGYAVGATYGYVYIRAEYPLATARLQAAIDQAYDAGLLGSDVMDAGFTFDLEVRRGAGAYICGEETALFNSIEGYRGEPRQKPPFPTQAGLFGKPTVVNNVETLVNVLGIVTHGGAGFTTRGTPESTGTRLFCLSGHVLRPGTYEVEFGVTLGDVLDLAGGVRGRLRAILLGGAAGFFVGPDMLDLPLTFEDTQDAGVSLGSGVVMAFNDQTDFAAIAHRIAAFFRDESCGQCVPCRVGTMRQEETLLRMASAPAPGDSDLLGEIEQVMRDASICGLGHTASSAIRSAIRLGLIGGVA